MSIRKILIIMIILSLTITAVSAASGLDEIVRIAEANGYHCAESYVDETGTNMLNFTKGSEKLFIAYANESTVLMDKAWALRKRQSTTPKEYTKKIQAVTILTTITERMRS